MSDKVSARVVDQRVRNRIIEAIDVLAMGDEGVRLFGASAYFEQFYDFVPHSDDGEMPVMDSMTPEEVAAVKEVSCILDAACDATQEIHDPEELIATAWPLRVAAIAQKTHDLMVRRGRFSEEHEEKEPSQ